LEWLRPRPERRIMSERRLPTVTPGAVIGLAVAVLLTIGSGMVGVPDV